MDAEAEERLVALHGTAKPLPSLRVLRAGPLEVRLENGNLRSVRFGGHEVLREISYVIRDQDWGAYEPVLEDLPVEEHAADFRVSYAILIANLSNKPVRIAPPRIGWSVDWKPFACWMSPAPLAGTENSRLEATGFSTRRCC